MGALDLYPLMFDPIYKEKVWGGRNLETRMKRTLPPGEPIGETWDVIDVSEIRNGSLAGSTLSDAAELWRHTLVGDRVWERFGADFPLLVKVIDAQDTLSIQVHPDDAAACHLTADRFGKTECWYILHAEPGAGLIHGFERPTSRAEVKEAIARNELPPLLHRVPVRPGDALFVPARTVHALQTGLLVYELQQKSDTTFRLYDWGRLGLDGRPRQLHVQQSLDVLDFTVWPEHLQTPVPVPGEDGRFYLVACQHFVLERWDISYTVRWETDPESFTLLTPLDGALRLQYGYEGDEELTVEPGETVLVPADLGLVLLHPTGNTRVLRAYVPDLWPDVVGPLLHAGFDPRRIRALGGFGEANDLAPLLVGR